jgi:class 3 adenylate cyclase/CheY-like chemotaxis protein
MRDPPLVLIVDDHADHREILRARLASEGYATAQAEDGVAALAMARCLTPDLILLDVMMPGLDGFEVARRLRADPALPFMPIILVTARDDVRDIVQGLDAGADEYLTKPVEHAPLVARVRSILRTKALHDEVQAQKAELAAWNRTLERRVAEQVAEIERINRLRRFLPPQVAAMVVSEGAETLLASRRAEVTVLFSDMRGFTAFAEQAAPEEVMDVLDAYHRLAGPLIEAHEGTLVHFLGDGLMVVFNAPLRCADPAARAVRLARALRDGFVPALAGTQKSGAPLGIGIGIAHGSATVGQIGFEGRLDYAAIGRTTNLAARLCAEAADGQILVSAEVHAALGDRPPAAPLGALRLKGFAEPVSAYDVGGPFRPA